MTYLQNSLLKNSSIFSFFKLVIPSFRKKTIANLPYSIQRKREKSYKWLDSVRMVSLQPYRLYIQSNFRIKVKKEKYKRVRNKIKTTLPESSIIIAFNNFLPLKICVATTKSQPAMTTTSHLREKGVFKNIFNKIYRNHYIKLAK